jgi:hypothetical protein
MPLAHILTDIRKDALPVDKLYRAVRIKTVLEQLGFEPAIYDHSLVSNERASNMETQLNIPDGHQADFADQFEKVSEDRIKPGDVIIVTEAWHERCFKGLLSIDGGYYKKAPVVELWINHLRSFARYRVFSTRFAMYATAGLVRQTDTHEDWLQAQPYYKAEPTNDVSVYAVGAFRDNAASMDHMEASIKGTPVVAPDWGAASETVVHGLTGYLYRTLVGYGRATSKAPKLPSAPILEWVNDNFSLEKAVQQLEGYFARIAQRG